MSFLKEEARNNIYLNHFYIFPTNFNNLHIVDAQ